MTVTESNSKQPRHELTAFIFAISLLCTTGRLRAQTTRVCSSKARSKAFSFQLKDPKRAMCLLVKKVNISNQKHNHPFPFEK